MTLEGQLKQQRVATHWPCQLNISWPIQRRIFMKCLIVYTSTIGSNIQVASRRRKHVGLQVLVAVICCVRLKGSLDLLCISRLNIHGNLFYMSLCWKEDFEPNPRRANSIYMISSMLCIRFDSQKFSARLVCMSFLSILIALTGDSRAIVQAKYFDSFYDAQQFWKFNSSEFLTVDGN